MNSKNRHSSYKLLRWFGWLSSIVILIIAMSQALLLSSFLTSQMFQREGELTREFVQNILVADGSLDYLANPQDPVLKASFRNTTDHFKQTKDLLRANIYGPDSRVIWSSDPTMIGKVFPDENEELEEALKGELVVEPAHISEWFQKKKEHAGIDPAVKYFVECYIPVFDPASGKVIGVVEFYRAPVALTNAIYEGQQLVWIAALVSALVLFGSLYWIVRNADLTIKRQQSRLVEAETLTAVGELASSIAHNIRNPLSSIRSSAELALEAPQEDCSEQARDIITEVDRIGNQISQLLSISSESAKDNVPVDLNHLLERCVETQSDTFRRRKQTLSFVRSTAGEMVKADAGLLEQVINSLLTNASEAMEAGGQCILSHYKDDSGDVCIDIADNGSGMPAEMLRQIYKPFFTTKPQGLGLGLSLAKRIVERFDGELLIQSAHGEGTTATIKLPEG